MRLRGDQVRTEEVREWKGVHLLHFQASSCSQKVRILLREKGIPWESHPVDLARQQNVTPGPRFRDWPEHQPGPWRPGSGASRGG